MTSENEKDRALNTQSETSWLDNQQIHQALDAYQAPVPPKDLAERTLSRVIDICENSPTDKAPTLTTEQYVKLPFKWSELLSVAAILLLCATVVWPTLLTNTNQARQAMCRANLAKVGEAFARYALANNDIFPRTNIRPASNWYQIGERNAKGEFLSNSANLFTLLSDEFLDSSVLNCPENAHSRKLNQEDLLRGDWPDSQSISYSYQNQFSEYARRFSTNPELILMSDRNPQFSIDSKGSFYHLKLDAASNSRQHQSRGQNILRADGSVFWMETPFLPNQDNIFLAENIQDYQGNELPSSSKDVFLIP